MKVLFVALATAAALASQIFARAGESAIAAAAVLPLLPAANCDAANDPRHCRVASPKQWAPDERPIIEETLRRLTAHELVQGVLVAALENGYDGLRRYSSDARLDLRAGWEPKFSPGFVLYTAKVIGITDAFFQTVEMRDPISGYRFGDAMVLHELVHAFDNHTQSVDPGFTSSTGWVLTDNRWEYTNRVSLSEYNGVLAHALTSYGQGRYLDAWTRDRSFATALAFPLPTIQSLASPGETFADILAHLILDARARTYLKPDVVAWFETNIFRTLKEKARRGPPASTTSLLSDRSVTP
jgi:hypothetical protein